MAKLTKKSSVKTILREWLAALRGEGEYKGKYKQGQSNLHCKGAGRKKDTHCCLGVLSDLAVKAGVIDPPTLSYNNAYNYAGTTCILPSQVREWIGMSSSKGSFTDTDNCYRTLVDLNDGSCGRKGLSFKKIADVIESKPKGLFVKKGAK